VLISINKIIRNEKNSLIKSKFDSVAEEDEAAINETKHYKNSKTR